MGRFDTFTIATSKWLSSLLNVKFVRSLTAHIPLDGYTSSNTTLGRYEPLCFRNDHWRCKRDRVEIGSLGSYGKPLLQFSETSCTKSVIFYILWVGGSQRSVFLATPKHILHKYFFVCLLKKKHRFTMRTRN